MIIGILPTLRDLDAAREFLPSNERYRALNDTILNARGELPEGLVLVQVPNGCSPGQPKPH
jgi:hypothetical protein